MKRSTFLGYRRIDGTIGIRNHTLILPTAICSSNTAAKISNEVRRTVAVNNQHGCCQIGDDSKLTTKTLIGLGKNPNVAAVLVVALGCEGVPYQRVAEEIVKTGKPTELIVIQDIGGTPKAIKQGIKIANKLVEKTSKIKREEVDVNELIVATECGGSDWTSGVASNPAVGIALDKLIEAGGIAVFSETTEIIGAEHILKKRVKSEKVAEKLLNIVTRVESKAKQMGVDLRTGQPTPGNINGGLTTIEEKSLGAIYKAGKGFLKDVLEYADEIPKKTGLFFMDTPGQDIESITGMVAGGAQMIVFTTGRGTPTGYPIAPVLKVTGNPETYKKMHENMDVNVGTVIEGVEALGEAGTRILEKIFDVASGKKTKSEILNYKEFGIYKINPTF